MVDSPLTTNRRNAQSSEHQLEDWPHIQPMSAVDHGLAPTNPKKRSRPTATACEESQAYEDGSGCPSKVALKMNGSPEVLYRVALLISNKKQRSLNLNLMREAASRASIELVVADPAQWHLSRSEGPEVDAIVHKVSNHIARADAGDQKSKRIIAGFEVLI